MYIPWKSCFVSVSFGSTLLTNVYVPLVGVGDTMLAFLILTLGIGEGVIDWFPAAKYGDNFGFPGSTELNQPSAVNGTLAKLEIV